MRQACLIVLSTALCLSACSRDRDLPEPYRSLPVPRAILQSATARHQGRALFLSHCALCHGERADGRGVRREGLAQAPRDFTSAVWRAETSPRRVFYAIREGVRGTPMPAWRIFSDGETWSLVAYILSVGEGSPGPVR